MGDESRQRSKKASGLPPADPKMKMYNMLLKQVNLSEFKPAAKATKKS